MVKKLKSEVISSEIVLGDKRWEVLPNPNIIYGGSYMARGRKTAIVIQLTKDEEDELQGW